MSTQTPAAVDIAELDQLLDNADGLELLEGVLDASVSSGILASAQGVDLAALLADSEAKVGDAEEEFIDAHCKQLDELCRLYHEVTQCEGRLQEFERDISRFQGTLTATAEDIVSMQTRTVDLVHRIDNRKQVSQRLQRVYEALNECDDFCEKISTATVVDATFLQWIRELESHIAFLADNPDLETSQIHKTFNPKLEGAAFRAGDKLHKYLLKKLSMLTEENSNVSLIQQAIERQGQYAFAFLLRYNAPIANDILNQYIKMMSDVYLRQTKPIGKEVFEIVSSKGSRATAEAELFVTIDILKQLGGNKRSNAHHADVAAAATAAPGRGPAASMARPASRSISMSLGLAIDRIRGKVPDRREVTFADNALALRSIDTSYRLVAMDPTVTIKLDSTTCWVHRFSDLYCRLVNNVINEGRFIDHFFFSAGTTEQEESLLHMILDRSLDAATQIIVAEIPAITDLIGVLCAKRALELFKNFVTQSADPLPIMIMAGLFDQIGSALSARLEALMRDCLASLDDVLLITTFKPHATLPSAAKEMPLAEVVSHDAMLASRVAPHELITRYSDISGRMQLMNTMLLEGSRVGGGFDRTFFDDALSHHLSQSIKTILQIIHRLADRHPEPLCGVVFEVNNIGHIVMAMAWAEETHLSQLVSSIDPAQVASVAAAARTPIRGGRPPASPVSRRGASEAVPRSPDGDSSDATFPEGQIQRTNAGGFGKPAVLTNATSTVQYATLLEALKRAVGRYITLDMTASKTTSAVLKLVDWATATLGDDFFATAFASGTAKPLDPLPDSAPPEAEALEAVSTFHREWQAAMQKIVDGSKVLFPERAGELATFVMREYFAVLVVMNTKLKSIVDRVYPKAQAMKAKLVGNLAFTHEVAKYLHKPASQ